MTLLLSAPPGLIFAEEAPPAVITSSTPVSSTIEASETLAAASLELYQGPRVKKFPAVKYPSDQAWSRNEGWVTLSMMISSKGEPYEVGILDSTGNKSLEQTALKATSGMVFAPASFEGKPVESSYVYRFRYEMYGRRTATPEFAAAYLAVAEAVKSTDRARADTAMAALKALKISNLYEDALFGIATYNYAAAWGNDMQQLNGLNRALSGGVDQRYLPDELYRLAVQACFQVQIHAHLFLEALDTWKRMQKAGFEPAVLEAYKPTVAKIEALHDDAVPFDIDGTLENGRWHLKLLRHSFSVVVSEGRIDEVKLRCEKKYVYFAFDQSQSYKVSDKFGQCMIDLEGAPDTRFTFTQS
ncbi:MAG: energy transducer TonB [Steroidobacteraceae bacterium]